MNVATVIAAGGFLLAHVMMSSSLSAQAVTFQELHGRVVEAQVTQQRQVKSDLGSGTHVAKHVFVTAIKEDGTIEHTQAITITLKNGKANTRSWKAASKLDEPHAFRDGQSVVVFKDAALVRLRTLDEGGSFLKYVFAQGPRGLTCSVEFDFAKEEGVGKIRSKAVNFGKQVQILSSKELSRGCSVKSK